LQAMVAGAQELEMVGSCRRKRKWDLSTRRAINMEMCVGVV